MSSGDVSMRRSRRTPTTPSRYTKDFILESIVIKKEPKDTADSQSKSPRGSDTSDYVESAKKSKKQSSPRQMTEVVTRTTRRGSIKRLVNVEAEIPEDDGLSEKKKNKPSKSVDDVSVNTPEVEEIEQPVTHEIVVQDSGDDMSDCSREEIVTTSNLDSELNADSSKHVSSVILQHTTALSSSSSHSKDRESEETSNAQPSTEEISSSEEQTVKDSSSGGSQPISRSCSLAVFKALKPVLFTDKSTPGESGSEDTSVSISVMTIQPSPGTSPTKVISFGESGSKDGPVTVTVRTIHPSPEKSTKVNSPSKFKEHIAEGTKSKDVSVPISFKTTANKVAVVNIIRTNETRHIGLLSEQSQNQSTNVNNAVQIVSTSKVKSRSPKLVTADMLSKIRVNGRTVPTQTTHNDMQVLMYMSKNLITNCTHKVLKVSSSKISKPHRVVNNSNLMKHCQTASRFSDINFKILEAVGKEEEIVNELSLSYAGEETCDVDKKIQWMLFGQDLVTAMTDSHGRIPSNVVNDGDEEGKSKPKNAKISIESWSLALTVLNPNV